MASFVPFPRLISYRRGRRISTRSFFRPVFSHRSLKLQIQKKIESSRQQLNPSSLTVECMNKIINLQKSPDISPEEIGIPRPSGETPPPGRGPTRVRGWWLVPPRFKFIYICIPCARDARYEQPDAAIDFVLARRAAHPFRSE